MDVDVARLDRDREHRGQDFLGAVRMDEQVRRECAGRAALQAVRRVRSPVGPDDQGRVGGQAPPDALDREAAAVLAGAAAVRNEAVALDVDWKLRLGYLDRDV